VRSVPFKLWNYQKEQTELQILLFIVAKFAGEPIESSNVPREYQMFCGNTIDTFEMGLIFDKMISFMTTGEKFGRQIDGSSSCSVLLPSFLLIWTPEIHKYFSKNVRWGIETIFLLSRRKANLFSVIPRDIILQISAFIGSWSN